MSSLHGRRVPEGRREFVLAGVEYLLGARTPQGAAARRVDGPAAESLGIRLVAQLVGTSPTAPLHHFPDRACLVAAVGAEGFRRLNVDLESAVRRGIVALIVRYAQWAGAHGALFVAMYDPALAPDLEVAMVAGSVDLLADRLASRYEGATPAALRRRADAWWELLQGKREAYNAFARAVNRELESGALRHDVGDGELVHAATSLADGLAWQRITERQGSDSQLDRHARRTATLLVEGLRAR